MNPNLSRPAPPSTPPLHPPETLRYFALEGVTWPARPARSRGPFASIRRRARRRRRLDAERRFFDAYGRGGDRPPTDLVLDADFFVRPDVARAMEAWDAGGPLRVQDILGAAEAAAAHAADGRTRAAENVAHFAGLLEPARSSAGRRAARDEATPAAPSAAGSLDRAA